MDFKINYMNARRLTKQIHEIKFLMKTLDQNFYLTVDRNNTTEWCCFLNMKHNNLIYNFNYFTKLINAMGLLYILRENYLIQVK